MIHHSCDACKRMLDPHDELRYVVKLEGFAALEQPDADEVDGDRDHLEEIQEILERLEESESELIDENICRKLRYDLCAECYKAFIKNPLARERTPVLGFSEN